MSKNKRASNGNPIALVVTIVVVFIVALIVSVIFQLLNSSDFPGFGKGVLDSGNTSYKPEAGGSQIIEGDGAAVFEWQNHPVLIVGDSLTVGAREAITNRVENATIDAKVSRNMATGLSILEDWADSGVMTEDAIIVVCLANNITGATIESAQGIVDMIQPGQSLIMMTGHGLDSVEPVNEFLRTLPDYSYVALADWDLTIEQAPGLLADDGIHIATSQGNELYADLILEALAKAKPRQ